MTNGLEAAENELVWHSPKEQPFHIAGFAWLEREGIYRRMPKKPAHALREEVDKLADNTAGGQIRFQTDSKRLSIKVRMNGVAGMNHMPATGQCGFDCYIGPLGNQLYFNTTTADFTKPEYEFEIFDKGGSMQNITLYFPLYMGVEEVLVGLEPGAEIAAPPSYKSDRKIVVYGTSITQGGCAARPGMAYTNILSRRIPYEFYNLGFSGNGRGEPEVAHIISEIENPALLVLDYEANTVSLEMMRDSLPEFIRIYRTKHPDTPILVVSKIRYARENFDRDLLEFRLKRKKIQQDAVQTIRAQGDRNVHFLDGEQLLGADFSECSVDGAHPTDLGFLRMADNLEPVFKQLLGE